MRQSNGLRSERCDASHFIFHFKMKIMNGVDSCHVITAHRPCKTRNIVLAGRNDLKPASLRFDSRNWRNDVQHHHPEQWLERLLQGLLLSLNYKRQHQCAGVWNLRQCDEVERRIKFAIHERFNNPIHPLFSSPHEHRRRHCSHRLSPLSPHERYAPNSICTMQGFPRQVKFENHRMRQKKKAPEWQSALIGFAN